MPKHLSIDIETLGSAPTGAIVAVGAVLFSLPANVETLLESATKIGVGLFPPGADQFYMRVSFISALRGGTTDASTLDWWFNQSDAARAELTNPQRESLDDCLSRLAFWYRHLGRDTRVWFNGQSFDGPILTHAYKTVLNTVTPWPYNMERDVRTAHEMSGLARQDIPRPTTLTNHHALHDAIYQALCVQACYAHNNK